MNLVESFVLTPGATRFWNERFVNYGFDAVPGNYLANSDGYFKTGDLMPRNSNASGIFSSESRNLYTTPNYQRPRNSGVPVYPSGYGNNPLPNPAVAKNQTGLQKMITPPSWFCWPPIFLGAVFFLYGAAHKE